jgi:hypothetical protein
MTARIAAASLCARRADGGRSFSVQHMHWYTLRDGLIVAHTACRDDLGMMVQLGLLTRPTPYADVLTREKFDRFRHADAVYLDEIRNAGSSKARPAC